MLQLVDLRLQLDEKGRIAIPVDALSRMDIHTGDEVNLLYVADSEESLQNPSKEFILTKAGKSEQELSIQLPRELLEEAGIPVDADIDIVCMDQKIMILPTEMVKADNGVPPELMGIFREFGIPKEKVNVVLHSTTEKEMEHGKTGL